MDVERSTLADDGWVMQVAKVGTLTLCGRMSLSHCSGFDGA